MTESTKSRFETWACVICDNVDFEFRSPGDLSCKLHCKLQFVTVKLAQIWFADLLFSE